MAKFLPAGDVAVSIVFEEAIGPLLAERIRAFDAALAAQVPGITETVPSFDALLVYYEPSSVDYETLCHAAADCLARVNPAALPVARVVELPCCYRDPELGFELARAADRLKLSVDEVIRLQTSVDYLVYFIGFAPGQPYLSGMPAELAIPRLDTPRTATPAGSVGIGGAQCCVYSVESPGGFWVLGRTPVRLYDPEAVEPVLLRPGDRVRFVEVDRGEYEHIAAEVAAGRHRVRCA
jgi:KipI family sensor histidine kinase inhibitor